MPHLEKVVAVTGASGAMGEEVVSHLLASKNNYRLKLFIYVPQNMRTFFKRLLKNGRDRITLVRGNLADYGDVERLVAGADYVVHCGALIPPKSDHNPKAAFETNVRGTQNIIDAIKAGGRADEVKLVHVSTMALYGNRDHRHPWARMGDPVLPSAYDYYSASKAKGERCVLESGLPHWVVLRQTGIYHKYFLQNNLSDGLMFHTCWNAPLEWVTDSDSGRLIQNLLDRDVAGTLGGFWQNAYNIGGGAGCRETGYETFNEGFALMGAGAEQFFEPHWNVPRNFHGAWFSDSDDLNKWLDFRRETSADYWRKMAKAFPHYKLGKLVPAWILRKCTVERLLKNSNAPMTWIRLNKKGRIDAFWGGEEKFAAVPREWENFPLLAKGETPEGKIDYADLKDESKSERFKLNHGYDESKGDSELDLSDMREAANFRGGSVVSSAMKKGDLFTKLKWRCHNGHVFDAAPFTILKAGFWCPECCAPAPWAFDGAAAHIPFYAQVWYDTHDKSEAGNVYPYDGREDDDLLESAK